MGMYDLTSPKTVKQIASDYGFTFRKGLGQNFLADRDVLEKIAEAAEIDGGVLEIGPGFGTLTSVLAEKAEKVVAVELDNRLTDILKDTLSGYGNIKVIQGDVMRLDLAEIIRTEFGGKRISVAANLPYYITTPILTMLIEKKLPVSNIVVMVQKEVAERIAAAPGKKDYGAISVLCQYYCEPAVTAVVPASRFVPPPKVDSAVLRLKMRDRPGVEVQDEKMFFRVVKAAFAQRRKTLLNCLANGGFGKTKAYLSDMLEREGISPSARGETLGLAEFAKISDSLSE